MPTTWSSYEHPRIPTGSTGNDRVVDSDLIELAAAHGVATSYRNGERKVVEVDEDVVVRILGLLDVDAAEPESRTAALALARENARQLEQQSCGSGDDFRAGYAHPGTGAGAAAHLDQAFGFQHPHRLAQRRAADAEVAHQFGLIGQEVALFELPVDDHSA